jgi:phage shock protein A
MAGIFNRLFKMGQAEAHSVVNKMEDPIKMTEQGVRDLKKDLQATMQSLAEVKALANRMKKEADNSRKLAEDYERKARLLLQKMQSGELDGAEAERLAREALSKKAEAAQKAVEGMANFEKQKGMVDQMQGNVDKLKSTISSYENDLITLKARAKTAVATRKINQQMAKTDPSGTLATLGRMRERVEEEESLASAYGELASPAASVDDEINRALSSPDTKLLEAGDSLAALKTQMGISD